MRKCLIFLLCISLLSVVASAAELEGDPDNWGEYYVDPDDVVIGEVVSVNVGSYGSRSSDTEDMENDTLEASSVIEDDSASFLDTSDSVSSNADNGISLMSVNPVSSSDTSGLKAALLGILGDYDAIIVEYTNGNYTSREVTPDYVWICSFCLLALFIYCLFRLLGGWLIRKA